MAAGLSPLSSEPGEHSHSRSGSEPPLDEVPGEQAEQAKDNQHQPPGGGPLGSVIVAGLSRTFVLLHGLTVGGDPYEVNGTRHRLAQDQETRATPDRDRVELRSRSPSEP